MFFTAMLINTFHAALEDREEAFDRIGINVASLILTVAVLPGLVVGKISFCVSVETAFVSMKAGLRVDVGGTDALMTVGLSGCSAWNERTLPQRSASETIARLPASPLPL